MKFALFVAAVAAQEAQVAGEDCSQEPFICQNTGTLCSTYTDSSAVEVSTCQDCLSESRLVTDSLGEVVVFTCADDATEDSSSTLYAGAAAILAAATLMA